MAQKIIHCIGDSHADFFSGWNVIGPAYPEISQGRFSFFQSYRLDAVLAYNLCKLGTKLRGREKLMELLTGRIPRGSSIMLCFGEIDCRAHLLKQAEMQQAAIEDVVKECVDRYFTVIQEIRSLGFRVLVWNAIASSLYAGAYQQQEFPAYGSCVERNRVTELFNRCLQELCDKNQIIFVSIFDKLVNKRGLTKMKYYMDTIHLSQAAMPLTLRELNRQTLEDFSETPMDRVKLLLSELRNFKFFSRLYSRNKSQIKYYLSRLNY